MNISSFCRLSRPASSGIMRSISSTSRSSIVNTLPESYSNPEHPPRTNEGHRLCQIIALRPETLKEYEDCHREVWPSVLNALRRAKVVDYSIHHTVLPLVSVSDSLPSDDKETHLLIAHMRYMGQKEDFEKDMAKVAEDPETQRWWKLTDPMQMSFIPGATGSDSGPGWWTQGREVFRFEG